MTEKVKAVYSGSNPIQHGKINLKPNHGFVILNKKDFVDMKKVLGDKLKDLAEAQAEFDQSGEDFSSDETVKDVDDKDVANTEENEGEAESDTTPKGKAGRPRRTE